MSLTLEAARTAALFIDFQVDVCGAGGRMVRQDASVLDRFQAARDQAARLLQHVREVPGVFVVHVVHLFDPGYPELAGAHLHGMFRTVMSQGAFVQGSAGAAVVPELAPREGETLLRKTSISVFETTDLDVRLRRRDVATVVICGVVTHYAVLGATLSASDRGYRVVVPEDGCSSGSTERHESALAVMQPLAEVTRVDDVIAALNPASAAAR